MASSKKPAVKEDIELVIEKLSTNGTESLEANFAKKLKTYCKSIAESRKAETYSYLGSLVLHQLRKEHAQIRFGSLLIIEYLFERAHQFRLFICDNLNTYFKLCADIKGLRDCDYATENSEDNPDTVESSLNSGLSTRKRKAPVKKQLQPYVWAKKLRAKALECFLYWHSEFGNGYPALKNAHSFLKRKGIIELPRIGTEDASDASTSSGIRHSQSRNDQR